MQNQFKRAKQAYTEANNLLGYVDTKKPTNTTVQQDIEAEKQSLDTFLTDVTIVLMAMLFVVCVVICVLETVYMCGGS